MPREGYRSITVNEEIYQKLEKMAEKAQKSVAQMVTQLVNGKEA